MTDLDLSHIVARIQARFAAQGERLIAAETALAEAEAALAAANARLAAAEARVRQLEARPAVVLVYSDEGEETVRRACTVLEK